MRLGVLSAFGFVLALSSIASAQETGFGVNRFEPSERGSSWFVLDSLDLRGRGRPAVGVVGDYQFRPLAIYEPSGEVRSTIVGHVMTAHLGAGVVLVDRVRLSANLPLVLHQDGNPGRVGDRSFAPPSDTQAIGDLRGAADIRLYGDEDTPFAIAFGARAWVPTGEPQSYTGDGRFRVSPHLLFAGDFGSIVYAARVGAMMRDPKSSTFGGSAIGHELVYAAAIGASLVDDRLTVGPEIFGSTVMTGDTFKTRSTPLEGILGAHYQFANGLRLGAGGGAGLTRGYGAPLFRVLATLEWSPEIIFDEDNDGIVDDEDACMYVPGIFNVDPRKNGCPQEKPPPPPDRDGDGIPDVNDACPEIFGRRTGDPRTNGCTDRDGDGIIDPLDACPYIAGIRSADPRLNGCPDPDPDKDGILGAEDMCPQEPGVKSSDPNKNGCPETDRDKDGIPDDQDACPDEAGKADPDPKKNGCPVAFVAAGLIQIREQVKFETGSAVIQRDSEEILEGIAKILREHPEIKRVRVEGYTDNKGTVWFNRKLSKDRAAAVVAWLVKHGIDPKRLSSEGFGPDKPIDVNTTEEGRKNNRRVELRILDNDAPKK